MTDALWRAPSFHVETAHLLSFRTGPGPRWRHIAAARSGTLRRETARARLHPKVQASKGIKYKLKHHKTGKWGANAQAEIVLELCLWKERRSDEKIFEDFASQAQRPRLSQGSRHPSTLSLRLRWLHMILLQFPVQRGLADSQNTCGRQFVAAGFP